MPPPGKHSNSTPCRKYGGVFGIVMPYLVKKLIEIPCAFGLGLGWAASFILLALLLSGTGALPAYAQKINGTLHVYTWPNVLPHWVETEFYNETGIRLEYSFFASQSSMLYNMDNTDFRCDVALVPLEGLPSLTRKGKAAKIDYSALPALPAFMPHLRGNGIDPNFTFMLPLYWGVEGLLINPRQVDADSITSYKDLLRPELEGRIALPRNMSRNMRIALLMNGFSANSLTKQHIDESTPAFVRLTAAAEVFASVGMTELLGQGVAAVAVGRNKADTCCNEPELVFKWPEEGSTMWMDGLILSSSAGNVEAAYKFISFLLRPETAARLSDATGLAVSMPAALPLIKRQAMVRDPLVYLPEELYSRCAFGMPIPEELAGNVFKTWVHVLGKK